MKRSNSSARWLNEHFNDNYVKRAWQAGYRSRAAYKLLELHAKDNLLRPGMTVVDLGAAPGGWAQVAKQQVGERGRVFALDIIAMPPIAGVEFIQGDFSESAVIDQLHSRIDNYPIDLVMSDMAPNISGIISIDQARSIQLAELALDFALQVLNGKGNLLVKVFQGEGFDAFLTHMRTCFNHVKIRKPNASRSRSSELYLVGLGVKTSSQKG